MRAAGRKRRAEARGNTLLQELDEPVARGAGDAVVDHRNEDGMHGRLPNVARIPVRGLADIDLGFKRDHDIIEDDVVAAAGAQAVVIPGLDDARARQARRHQKLPTRGSVSSVRAQTRYHFRIGDPVE